MLPQTARRSISISAAFACLILITAVLGAQTPMGCPVTMDPIRIDHNLVNFSFQNTSGQVVDAVAFDAAYYDNVHKPHHIDVVGDYVKTIHPGKRRKGTLGYRHLVETAYSGVSIWPTKVLYRDGTEWTMPKSGQDCGAMQEGKEWQTRVLPPRMSVETQIVLAENIR